MPYHALATGFETAFAAMSKGRMITENACRALSITTLLPRRSRVINNSDVKMSSTTTRRRLNDESTGVLWRLVVAAERHQPAHRVEVLECAPGADHDAVQRVVGDLDRHNGLVIEAPVDARQK